MPEHEQRTGWSERFGKRRARFDSIHRPDRSRIGVCRCGAGGRRCNARRSSVPRSLSGLGDLGVLRGSSARMDPRRARGSCDSHGVIDLNAVCGSRALHDLSILGNAGGLRFTRMIRRPRT